MLNVVDIRVRYGEAVIGVESATLSVGSGEVVSLLGANGAGKTTVLRAVAGLLAFHRGRTIDGRIDVDGTSLRGLSAAKIVGLGVASSLEGRRIFGDLTVAENLRLGGFRLGRASGRELDRVVDLFPRLAERREQAAGSMSGGEQQMLAIGRAMMAAPRLLLLDEPSMGLAPKIVREIGAAIRRIAAAGTSVLMVDQNVALASQASDRTYVMDRGHTRINGATSEVLADDSLLASYLGDVEEVRHGAAGRI